MKKKLLILFVIILALIGIAYFLVYPKMPILTGYAAKKACSCYYIANRNKESILNYDLAKSPLNLASIDILENENMAEASVFGLGNSKAYYSPKLGCRLIKNDNLTSKEIELRTHPKVSGFNFDQKQVGFDQSKINEAIREAFDDDEKWEKQTRALVIIQDDSLIAEHYAPGFNKDSKILGWSMTKSITNALVGILVKQGKLQINKTALFEEWLDDKRRNISLDHLLRMNSGLEWEENYAEISPATNMLFQTHNMGDYASSFKSEFEPGDHWEYSSGTTNIISKLIRDQFDNDEDYHDFPYKLFSRLGIESFVMEADASGHYVMSSYCFGTPRDWAKLGLLYLNDGIMGEDTILTKEWIDYSITPTENSTNGCYGAHLWLNTNQNELKNLPSSIYKFSGFEGQYVYIIPSKNAVVVRMGLSKGPPFDVEKMMNLIYDAL
ncbi:MAG: serine hydrolase [Saprospiraceae bacterium]|nr:beta-lactamase family protein [Bacteroidia bacterium]NNE16484.1 serine hydrolase [Saprospiraceae bacterium]NNL93464.1 serine hydrolase [Saprospiraceae bacterium]